jgi:hypothetical protein
MADGLVVAHGAWFNQVTLATIWPVKITILLTEWYRAVSTATTCKQVKAFACQHGTIGMLATIGMVGMAAALGEMSLVAKLAGALPAVIKTFTTDW